MGVILVEENINKRRRLLIDKKEQLFNVYDNIKDEIRKEISDDNLKLASSLLTQLEVINTKIEVIDGELEFLNEL